MDALDKHVIKTALETLRAAGGTGLKKAALLSQIDLAAGAPTTNEQREQAFQMLKERGWITSYMEPIWHDQRWILTERGMDVREKLLGWHFVFRLALYLAVGALVALSFAYGINGGGAFAYANF